MDHYENIWEIDLCDKKIIIDCSKKSNTTYKKGLDYLIKHHNPVILHENQIESGNILKLPPYDQISNFLPKIAIIFSINNLVRIQIVSINNLSLDFNNSIEKVEI